jgi:hypothetical protein
VRRRAGASTESGYWQLQIDSRFVWRDVVWLNDPEKDQNSDIVNGRPVWTRSFFGDGKGFGFFDGKPPPRLCVAYKAAAQLGDACYYSSTWWLIVSRHLAGLLQSFQPGGVATLPIEVELNGGDVVPAGEFVFFDVTHRCAAFDTVAMKRQIVETRHGQFYEPDLKTPYFLRKDIPADAMLFRDTVAPGPIFAAHAVREACREAGLWRRLRWKDPAARF